MPTGQPVEGPSPPRFPTHRPTRSAIFPVVACRLSKGPFTRSIFKYPILLVPKIGSCEHNENDLPTHGSVVLKIKMEIEHALFSSDTLLERWKTPTNVIVLAPNWRFFASSESRIVWTPCRWPSDILTTKTEPWNRTVWTAASNFENQESDP